ncbi:hypothetical protein [Thiorhodococcus fuscus]|uniref:Uncharacterized protein n=1 Tax=Thiorhodococcus fuscus TaxID=527200 RepID=A0ABW4Y6Y5_9GAMM
MGALGILAAVVLVIGGVQSTVNFTDTDHFGAASKSTPVIEVQAIQPDATQHGN